MAKKKAAKAVDPPTAKPGKVARKVTGKRAVRGKNIIICLDGTGNHFKEHNSNVVKLFRSITRGTRDQVAYYDAGVGTLAAPDFKTPSGKKLDKALGLAFGTGLAKNVGEAYRYLMAQHQPGDRVFVFGFSRGAYTARALAGLIHCCGLLEPGLDNLIPYALKLFSAAKKLEFQVIARFKSTYARKAAVDIQLLGLWDTVSSYGWIYNPVTLPYTTNNDSVRAVRHALAIDERRVFFKPRRWGIGTDDTKEVWFAGVHSDVGGGYPEAESALSKYALEWMITEARGFGLKVDESAYRRYVLGMKGRKPAGGYIGPGPGEMHQSLKGPWWIAEFLPQRVWDTEVERRRWQLIPRPSSPRSIRQGDTLHRSVLERIMEGGYCPANLKAPGDTAFPDVGILRERFRIEG